MTERVPHLTWTFYGWRPLLRCIQPSCIDSVTQNKKKEIAIWGNELWWLNSCLKLYKRTRESLRTDNFFPFSRFKNTLPKNLTLSWHFCSRMSRFKDFKIFETTSRWKLILTRAAYSREKCVSKRGTDELGTTLHTNQGWTKHAEYNLLCYASFFATLNLFIMKKNNSHTVLYAHTVH